MIIKTTIVKKIMTATWLMLFIGLVATGYTQKKKSPSITKRDSMLTIRQNLRDDELLDLVQKQTFRYFWDFGHPVSGLSRERSNRSFNYGDEVVTTGGSGFGVMAIIVDAARKWITREQAVERLLKMINFLRKSDHYHGIF